MRGRPRFGCCCSPEPPALLANPSLFRCYDLQCVCLGRRDRREDVLSTRWTGQRRQTSDLAGAVRRRQGFVSRRGVDRPRRSGADARCAPRVAILCRSGSVPGSRVSAWSFGPCARPGSRLARASVATGRRTAVLAVVSARHAPVCCCLVIHAPWRARAETGNLASVSITGACARQISWGIGVLQPPRCPRPHQRNASRRGRPRPDDYFPSTHARAHA